MSNQQVADCRSERGGTAPTGTRIADRKGQTGGGSRGEEGAKRARIADRRWRFLDAASGDGLAVVLDDDGIPVLDDGDCWPLELDHDH